MSLLEIAQEVDRLAKEADCSELEIMSRALNVYRLWLKVGQPAYRELLGATIEACVADGTTFGEWFQELQKRALPAPAEQPPSVHAQDHFRALEE